MPGCPSGKMVKISSRPTSSQAGLGIPTPPNCDDWKGNFLRNANIFWFKIFLLESSAQITCCSGQESSFHTVVLDVSDWYYSQRGD